MAETAVTHLFTHLRGLSGVESMVRRHLRGDRTVRLAPDAVTFFEDGDFKRVSQTQLISGLGLTGKCCGLTLRRRFRQVIPRHPEGVRVYHEGWGMVTLADLDRAQRRFAFLHSHWTGAERFFRGMEGLLDGVFCVSPAIQEAIRQCLPTLPPERVRCILNPVDPPPSALLTERPAVRNELVLGFCGRVVRQPKRVERLPELARLLVAQGIPHRWEILGNGPDRPVLEQMFEGCGAPVHFHGALTGDAFWQALSGWDLIVFASDFEGMPLALLEALSIGVLPLFPRLPSGGRDATERIAPELVYESGHLEDAVRAVTWLRGLSAEAHAELRERGRNVVRPHACEDYHRAFAEFVEEIVDRPRISATGIQARRWHVGEWAPYTLLKRLQPSHFLRRGYL